MGALENRELVRQYFEVVWIGNDWSRAFSGNRWSLYDRGDCQFDQGEG